MTSNAARRFDPLAYRDPRPWPALIRALGPINRHLLLRRLLRLAEFRVPDADLARLRASVHPDTTAFLGPNHPEFMTDWLVDKEISRLVSPLMAHWASYEIVNGSPLAQRFWLANNLVANVPGGGGKAYSVRWALAGHGVLLHPEGTATWQSDRVGPLLPGIVDMAWTAAEQVRERGGARRVFVVPLLWKLHFTGDAAAGLAREMGAIERALGLPHGAGPVERRFAALLASLLVQRCVRLGVRAPELDPRGGPGYFAAQREAVAAIRAALEARHGEVDADPVRAQHQLRRAIRRASRDDAAGARLDRDRLAELQRLWSFDPALYDRPTLAQEHLAETLKRTRTSLMTRGTANALHNLLPVAVAPRAVHVRVPEPLDVTVALAASADADASRAALLERLRTKLQAGLDQLNAEIAPVVDRGRRPNPLHSGA